MDPRDIVYTYSVCILAFLEMMVHAWCCMVVLEGQNFGSVGDVCISRGFTRFGNFLVTCSSFSKCYCWFPHDSAAYYKVLRVPHLLPSYHYHLHLS